MVDANVYNHSARAAPATPIRHLQRFATRNLQYPRGQPNLPQEATSWALTIIDDEHKRSDEASDTDLHRLIELSSLGTKDARALRNRIAHERPATPSGIK